MTATVYVTHKQLYKLYPLIIDQCSKRGERVCIRHTWWTFNTIVVCNYPNGCCLELSLESLKHVWEPVHHVNFGGQKHSFNMGLQGIHLWPSTTICPHHLQSTQELAWHPNPSPVKGSADLKGGLGFGIFCRFVFQCSKKAVRMYRLHSIWWKIRGK